MPTLQPIATKICSSYRLLRKSGQHLCQIWWRSHHSDLRNTGVEYNTFVRFYSNFSFPFLSNFILAIAYSLNWFSCLMTRNAWICARKCLLYVWTMSDQFWEVESPKNYPRKASDAEIPAKWIKSNNFKTVQDRQKLSMQHEHELRVALSKSVVKKHLRRPQAKITLWRHFLQTVKLNYIGNGAW